MVARVHATPDLSGRPAPTAIVGVLLGGLGGMAWCAFSSGAVPLERRGAPLPMLAVSLATVPLLDISVPSSMMGLMFPVSTAPVLSPVVVAWAVATRRFGRRSGAGLAVGRDRAGLHAGVSFRP